MCYRVVCAATAAAAVLTACGFPFGDSPPQYGFISVSSGGDTLTPGFDQVPPTLDLRLHAEKPMRQQDVTGQVDSRALSFTVAGSDVVASTSPLPLGSHHHLSISIAGRAQGISLDFSVIPPTSAMFAAHIDPDAGVVVDGVFDDPPEPSAVAAALPGASLTWRDPTHVRLSWSGSPPDAVDLPAGLTTARGSHLGGAVHLTLAGIAKGELRRVTSPASPVVAGTNVVAFVVNSSESNSSLAHHQSVLDWVSATGWQAEPDGSIVGTPDAAAVDRARSVRLPLWPNLANDAQDADGTDSLLKNPQAVSALVSTVVQSVVDGGFPGVNLDFEGMHAVDKDAFTAFVKSLAAALHGHGVQLTVDVVPHGSTGVNQYSAAYDVPALGSAADFLDVMAYDEHGEGSSPGPVAGLDWVKGELTYTLPGLQAGHTLLGIPLYGRAWTNGSGSTASYGDVLSALQASGARVDYDFGAQTPYVVSGDAGTITYFDDADSLQRKIGLAHQLGLGGVAAWRLGFEDPAFWSLFG
ncbi:MAG TPA: glycosyl hydrolase family 18 protein [Candidatus Dormibacteraeota bacterium]